jgi:hypothetical protein
VIGKWKAVTQWNIGFRADRAVNDPEIDGRRETIELKFLKTFGMLRWIRAR